MITAASVVSFAQGPYDAWLFSDNNYEGTARSVAMGNAFTALGGDLGSISINPAGSAVAGYSQISITPELTFSTNTAAGVPYDGSTDPYFQREMKSRKTKFTVPNFGLTFNFNTGRKSGIKNVTVGFVLNAANTWCEDIYANGTNSQTSFLAALADDATREMDALNSNKPSYEQDYTKADYLSEQAFDYMNWQNTIAYRSGMISAFDTEGKKFIGATETLLDNGDIMQSGKVNQTYGRTVSGSKYEYLFNLGMNVSDFVYFGANIGITSINYDYTHYFRERAIDADLFENRFYDSDGVEHSTYFKEALYNHYYSAEGTGIFGKFGVIVTPMTGLRIGAAIQTPTSTTIKEQWQDRASTTFSDSKFNGEADSDLGRSEYDFNSPFRANFGLAYTMGSFAIISADYEVAGYGTMKYCTDISDMSEEDFDYFLGVNETIKNTYGAAHYLRLGAEVRPFNVLSVRAGYNLGSSAVKKYYDADTDSYLDLNSTYTQNISFGLGFSSKGSFFADLACRYNFVTKEYIYPYSDYLAESNGIWSPEILSRHSNWKLLMTLGWRF